MKAVFFIVVAAMVVLTLSLIVWPLLRQGRAQGRPGSIFMLILAVIVAVPLGTFALYRLIGTPATLNGVPKAAPPIDIAHALDALRAHLAQQPDDVSSWLLLAQTDTALQQPAAAHEAYDRVLKLQASNSAAMIGWAETDAMQNRDHQLSQHARDLLQQVLDQDPNNQRALWLLGIGQFQQNQFTQAAATWRRLLPLLEPGSKVASAVAEQIAAADARAGTAAAATVSLPDAAAAPTPAKADGRHGAAPALHVQVSLAPALQAQVKPGDTLFIYARALNGPPMPLAVTRMDASALPASVTLTDAMAMTPALKLSSVQRVQIGARISHSGQATPQKGDLEGSVGDVAVNSSDPITIVIDKVH